MRIDSTGGNGGLQLILAKNDYIVNVAQVAIQKDAHLSSAVWHCACRGIDSFLCHGHSSKKMPSWL